MGSPETLKGVALNGVDGWEILNPKRSVRVNPETLKGLGGWVGSPETLKGVGG